MIERPFWRQRIEEAWREAPIAWLSGVRRSGKTTLAESLGADHIYYVNCDLPTVEDMVSDPRVFFRSCVKPVVVFDEIHQLRDPTRLLKIGADVFPKLKILATGSSTLAASKKFRDTLTGRMRLVHLTPVLWDELLAFGTGSGLRNREPARRSERHRVQVGPSRVRQLRPQALSQLLSERTQLSGDALRRSGLQQTPRGLGSANLHADGTSPMTPVPDVGSTRTVSRGNAWLGIHWSKA